MRFYKLTEFRYKKDKSFILKTNNSRIDIDYKLNHGISEINELLTSINLFSGISRVSIQLRYYHEVLEYYIGIDGNLDPKTHISTAGTFWIEKAPPTNEYFFKIKYAGAFFPRTGHEVKTNLVDRLVRKLNNKPFNIIFDYEVDFSFLNKHTLLTELNKTLKFLSKQKEKNSPGIIIVGFGSQTVDSYYRSMYEHLSEVYSLISQSPSMCAKPRLTIEAADREDLLNIEAQVLSDMLANNVFGTNYLHRTDIVVGGTIAGLDHDAKAKDPLEEFNASLWERFRAVDITGDLKLDEELKRRFLLNEYIKEYVPVSYVSPIIAYPLSGIPGIKYTEEQSYGTINDSKHLQSGLSLGALYKNYQTKLQVRISQDDLIKHTLVTGVTGSGKTTTIKSMLISLFDSNIPFLILEPAKTEYKALKIEELKRYLLGIETKGCLKINPFEFPYKKEGTHGVHLQTHLDLLKSIFIAAFPMYGPMPYVLETAFYHIYQWYGWDFKSGHNIYWDDSPIDKSDLFPTLDDLYNAIDHIVSIQGYSKDLQNDLTAALKVRVGSLKSGAKGTMLNTKRGTDIGELLSCPTVIELERIGDAQEKVFIMGLLLVSIYEHYIAEGNESEEKLKHLIVIEEAHRLLENVQQSNNNEIADMKGKAIETFNNILSEIRAYGQGIVVADQIPTKISPDVIKNTNLKIIHRLFSLDDRNAVGDAIGLDHKQKKGLIHLQTGEAIVFHSGLQEAVKIMANSLGLEKGNTTSCDGTIKLNTLDVVASTTAIYSEVKKVFQTALVFGWNYTTLQEKLRVILGRFSIKSDGELIDQLVSNLVEWFAIKLRNNSSIPYSFREENDLKKLSNEPGEAIEGIRSFVGSNGKTIYFPKTLNSTYVDALEYFIYVYTKDRKTLSSIVANIRNARKDKFRYYDTETQSLLLADSDMDKYFSTDELSEDDKGKLCQCLVYFCSFPHTGFEYYFDQPQKTISDTEYLKQLKASEDYKPETVSTKASTVDSDIKSLLESITVNLKEIGQKKMIDPAIKSLIRLPIIVMLANTLFIILAVLYLIFR